jgi:hypothetical protein
MGKEKITDAEKRYWRIYAAVQEMCHADDEDIAGDKMLADFISHVSRAIRTYQDQKSETNLVGMKKKILKEVGIPMIAPKGDKHE